MLVPQHAGSPRISDGSQGRPAAATVATRACGGPLEYHDLPNSGPGMYVAYTPALERVVLCYGHGAYVGTTVELGPFRVAMLVATWGPPRFGVKVRV